MREHACDNALCSDVHPGMLYNVCTLSVMYVLTWGLLMLRCVLSVYGRHVLTQVCVYTHTHSNTQMLCVRTHTHEQKRMGLSL